MCTLDNALENSYEAHLLDKGTLPINYNTYINQSQNISGQVDIAINVSRAISRLKSIFFNFSKKTSANRAIENRAQANGLADCDNGLVWELWGHQQTLERVLSSNERTSASGRAV